MGVSDNIEISKALLEDRGMVATERISRGAAKSRSSTPSKLHVVKTSEP